MIRQASVTGMTPSRENIPKTSFSSATHLLFKPDEGEGAIFTQRATNMLTQIFLAARLENYPPLPYVRQMLRRGFTPAAEQP